MQLLVVWFGLAHFGGELRRQRSLKLTPVRSVGFVNCAAPTPLLDCIRLVANGAYVRLFAHGDGVMNASGVASVQLVFDGVHMGVPSLY